jgi:hypothetical protein
MSRIDHSRTNTRDLMRSRGVDNIADYGLPGGLTPPRPTAKQGSPAHPDRAGNGEESRASSAAKAAVIPPPS